MRVKRWDQPVSSKDTNSILSRLALWHLSKAPRDVYDLTAMVMDGRYRDICTLEISPLDCSPDEFYHWSQVKAFFSKRRDLKLGVDPRAAAKEAFLRAEALCRETNSIFKMRARGEFCFSPRVESVLHSARRKIARLLGDVPRFEDLNPRFGPGATTQLRKAEASSRAKLAQEAACSEDMVGAAHAVLNMFPRFRVSRSPGHPPVALERGRIDFVPKSWKTMRGIAVEPMLNTFIQLGIGDYLAHLLRRCGTDIRDQSKNQYLAKVASIDGSLATLDLSSASDTVSEAIVEELLPLDWFFFLRTFRTGKVTLDKEPLTLSKFSTMGNGFTFPLETLIFKALSEACSELAPTDECHDPRLCSVYGDDIIVPTYCVDLLAEVLTACGFLLNKDKSFTSGPFRESCGKDYFSGIDVRPWFAKDSLLGADLFQLHNFYFRRGEPEAARIVLKSIDKSCQIFGPDGFGDGHLLVDDFVGEPFNRPYGWSGFTFQTHSWAPRLDYHPWGSDYEFALYDVYASPAVRGLPGIDTHPASPLWEDRSPFYGKDRGFSEYSEHEYLGTPVPGRSKARLTTIYYVTRESDVR